VQAAHGATGVVAKRMGAADHVPPGHGVHATPVMYLPAPQRAE
jgi:hypothetical protein